MKNTGSAIGIWLLMFILSFAVLSYLSPGYGQGVSSGLVAHYTFDGDLKDYSGCGNHGKKAGTGLTFTNGMAGKGTGLDALKFNGKSYIEVADSKFLDIEKAFTFSAWINKTNNRREEMVPVLSKCEPGKAGNASPYAWFLGDSLISVFPGVKLVDSATSLDSFLFSRSSIPRQWVFVTVVYDGSNVLYYADGVRIEYLSRIDKLIAPSAGKLYIGADFTREAKYFSGMMDEVRIYNTALPEAAVKSLYRNADSLAFASAVPGSLKQNQSVKLKVAFKPLRGKTTDVSSKALYISSDPRVVSVSKGVLKTVSKGKATVTVTYGAHSITAEVSVK